MKMFTSGKRKAQILLGLFWGGFMFLFMSILMPMAEGEPITRNRVLFGILIWGLGGQFIAYINALSGTARKPTETKS